MEALRKLLADAVASRAAASAAAREMADVARAATIAKATDALRRAAVAATEARAEMQKKCSGTFAGGPVPTSEEVSKVTAAELKAWDAYIAKMAEYDVTVETTA